MKNMTEYFAEQDLEILINEAYDYLMDVIEELKLDSDKQQAYLLISQREYVKCFDYLWKATGGDLSSVTSLGWALRNFYEYERKMSGKT